MNEANNGEIQYVKNTWVGWTKEGPCSPRRAPGSPQHTGVAQVYNNPSALGETPTNMYTL